jgi:Uma2 family endonuclease
MWPPLLVPEPASAPRPLSLDEWLALDEDEAGELVDGHLVEEEAPDAVHELAVAWLIRVLGAWLQARGFVFGSELKVRTGPRSGRKADVVVYLPGTPAPPSRGPITVAPDILVEVVTPSPRDERRDRVEKMAEYAGFGVRWYWIVDPALGSFEIFGLTGAGNYARLAGVVAGVISEVPGCPGLTVDVDALWAELQRLPGA